MYQRTGKQNNIHEQSWQSCETNSVNRTEKTRNVHKHFVQSNNWYNSKW